VNANITRIWEGKSVAKLGDFKTPTGASGNIFRISDWFALILGSVVLLITFAMGQNFANKLNGKVPLLDAQPDPVFKQPQPIVNNQKQRVVL
jgi:hypothetical protein